MDTPRASRPVCVECITATVLAPNVDTPAAAAVPSRVDHVLAVNLERVRDDFAAFKEAIRRSSHRKYSANESPAAPCYRRASFAPTLPEWPKPSAPLYAQAYRFDVSNGF